MKNNKIFFLLVSFGLLTGFFSSCQKDSVTLRLRMANFSRDGKVHMDGLTPKWDAGEDLVCVNGEACTVSNNSVSVTPSIDYKAVYPASICGSLENVNGVGVYNLAIPEYQVYKTVTVEGSNLPVQVVEAPMGAHSNTSGGSTDLYFKNLGALLAITVDNQAGRGDLIVDKIIVTSDSKPLWGSATLAMPDVTTQNGDYNPSYIINETDNNHQSVILAGNANGGSMNVSIASGYSKQFYVYVPAFSPAPSNKFTFEVQVHNNAGEGVYRRAQTSSGSGNIPLNQVGSLTFALTSDYQTSWVDNNRPAGALLQGEFTVKAATSTAPAKKVYFSAGNLQYKPSENKWRIAEHQWDYVGYTTSTGTSYPGTVSDGNNMYTSVLIDGGDLSLWTHWIDLFGWGTSGYIPTNSTNQAMPYDYEDSKNYGGTGNLDADYDWGLHNTIYYDVRSSQPGTWRTLTRAEWNYLLGVTNSPSRPARSVGGGSGLGYTHSFVKVHVGNVDIPGLLIYPDEYSANDRHPSTHDGNTEISLSDYPSCAFLPCAGLRTENIVSNVPGSNPLGYYWTANREDDIYAGHIYFPVAATVASAMYQFKTDLQKYKGLSVRLVTEVPSSK